MAWLIPVENYGLLQGNQIPGGKARRVTEYILLRKNEIKNYLERSENALTLSPVLNSLAAMGIQSL